MTEFALVTNEKRVPKGTVMHVPNPCPKGGGTQFPEKFGTSYMRAHSMRNNNQILHDDKTICEENFYMIDRECITLNMFAVVLLCPAPNRRRHFKRCFCLTFDVCLTSVCLSRTSGLTREQRGLGRLKLAQR